MLATTKIAEGLSIKLSPFCLTIRLQYNLRKVIKDMIQVNYEKCSMLLCRHLFKAPRRLANNVVPNPKTAIKAKEMRRLETSAIKPITGGPSRKPKKPMEDTIAIAIPGAMLLERPARLYTYQQKAQGRKYNIGNDYSKQHTGYNNNAADLQYFFYAKAGNKSIGNKPATSHGTHKSNIA